MPMGFVRFSFPVFLVSFCLNSVCYLGLLVADYSHLLFNEFPHYLNKSSVYSVHCSVSSMSLLGCFICFPCVISCVFHGLDF